MYSCETLFPAHNQITIIKNPSAAEGRHNHTFFELDCVKVRSEEHTSELQSR